MKHLTKEQMYQIKAYLNCGKSKIFIAESLKVNKTTIYRELKRNSNKGGRYNPDFAQELSTERKERFASNRKFTPSVEKYIKKQIEQEQWSPEQIAGYCKSEGIDMVSIELRSDIINNKERFGDWEIDLIIGKDGKGAIVTIVERTTAFFLMKKLPFSKKAEELADTVIDMLMPYKKFVHSITSDNGTEFAEHIKMSKKLLTEFFFAHPYSSWERGLSEYTNKLLSHPLFF